LGNPAVLFGHCDEGETKQPEKEVVYDSVSVTRPALILGEIKSVVNLHYITRGDFRVLAAGVFKGGVCHDYQTI
jgi:hypothetical protein